MRKNICESRLGIEYIADVISSCEQNGVQCIVDDANGIFYVYDNREKGNLLYCTSKDIYNGDSTIFDMFRDREDYNRIMLPGNGDDFKEFCVTWNDLQKKGDKDKVFKTNGCKPILGLTMESLDDMDDRPVRYRWVASSDDGAWDDQSSRTFYKQSDCYKDMMEHAIDKMKWNVEWDDVISDCNAYEEDGLVKTNGEMNAQGDQVGGDTWGIYYQLECHPHMIQHLSGSGLYTYKIEVVTED